MNNEQDVQPLKRINITTEGDQQNVLPDALSLLPYHEAKIHQNVVENLEIQGLSYVANEYASRVVKSGGYDKQHNESTPITSRVLGGLVLGAAIASLVFEQGPANEAVRASAAFDVLQSTDGNYYVAGTTVGAITMAVETTSGLLVAAGFKYHKERITNLINRFKRRKIPEAETKEVDATSRQQNMPWKGTGYEPAVVALNHYFNALNRGTEPARKKLANRTVDVGVALGLGSALVVTRRHAQHNERTLNEDVATVLRSSTVIAGVSAAVATLATGGIKHAEAVGVEKPAELFVDYATDWRFWGVVCAAIYGGSYLKRITNKQSN